MIEGTSAHQLAQAPSGQQMLTQKQKARLILHWLSSSQRRMPRHKVAAVEELGDFHDAFRGQYRPGLIAFTNRCLNNVKCEALHSDLARRLPRSAFVAISHRSITAVQSLLHTGRWAYRRQLVVNCALTGRSRSTTGERLTLNLYAKVPQLCYSAVIIAGMFPYFHQSAACAAEQLAAVALPSLAPSA